MEERGKEARHAELNQLMTMAEACVTACAQVEGGQPAEIPGTSRNRYASLLAKCLKVYTLSDDRQQIAALDPNDVRSGTFRDGGRELVCTDGRTFGNLAVKRSAFTSAVDLLKRAHAAPSTRE